jgi:amphi-Trp domain-containing protein
MPDKFDDFEFDAVISLKEAVEHLSSLAAGLRKGVIQISHGENTLIVPSGTEIELEFSARSKSGETQLQLEMYWTTGKKWG